MRLFTVFLFVSALGACAVNFESAIESPSLVQTVVTTMNTEDAVKLGRQKLVSCLDVGSEGKFKSGTTYIYSGAIFSLAERRLNGRVDQAVFTNTTTAMVLSYEAIETGTQVTAYSNSWGMNKWAKRAVLWFGKTDVGCRP